MTEAEFSEQLHQALKKISPEEIEVIVFKENKATVLVVAQAFESQSMMTRLDTLMDLVQQSPLGGKIPVSFIPFANEEEKNENLDRDL